MTAQTKSHNALSETTTSLESYFVEDSPVNKTVFDDFVHVDFNAANIQSLNPGVDIDDYLSQFDNDSEAQAALSRGAKWVAERFYEDDCSLKSLRLRNGLSQKELADKIGTAQSYVSRIETKGDDIRRSTIIKLSEALNTDLETIIKAT